jgi:hypothetical protein
MQSSKNNLTDKFTLLRPHQIAALRVCANVCTKNPRETSAPTNTAEEKENLSIDNSAITIQ